MKFSEINKLVVWVLAAVVLVVGLNALGDAIFDTGTPDDEVAPERVAADHGESADGADASAPAAGDAPAGDAPAGDARPAVALMAGASAEKGAKVFKKCKACHSTNAGGRNGAGPNLYGIVGRKIASHAGFRYSPAMREYGAGKVWSVAELDGFLTKPRAWVKGTAMMFGGIKKPEQRADLIAYLSSLSD